jgi:hypothetical protein
MTYILLQILIVLQLIVKVEVALGQYLEKRLAVEVDLVVVLIGLVVDIGVGEAALYVLYPLEMMSPLASLSRTVLTPWIRTMSPHFIVYCYYDIRYLAINKL